MAPERRHHEETKLGDVYWLGCVLWETLAGPGSHLPGRIATAQDAGVAGRSLSSRMRQRDGEFRLRSPRYRAC